MPDSSPWWTPSSSSPLGQVPMIPMLAWTANSAPSHIKATFFAVRASFANLALSLSQLATNDLNQVFTFTREVTHRATGAVTVPADYTQLGWIMLTVTGLALILVNHRHRLGEARRPVQRLTGPGPSTYQPTRRPPMRSRV
jgi:hypothetical protein